MSLNQSVTFYFSQLALKMLLEQGKITEEEYKAVCRYNAEILQPDGQYIRWNA